MSMHVQHYLLCYHLNLQHYKWNLMFGGKLLVNILGSFILFQYFIFSCPNDLVICTCKGVWWMWDGVRAGQVGEQVSEQGEAKLTQREPHWAGTGHISREYTGDVRPQRWRVKILKRGDVSALFLSLILSFPGSTTPRNVYPWEEKAKRERRRAVLFCFVILLWKIPQMRRDVQLPNKKKGYFLNRVYN